MSEKLPVVAAIPNYNMGQQLATLLPELAQQNYAAIYVLDDGSTDGSRDVVANFNHGTGVQWLSNSENKGAGPTRNLMIGALGQRALLHFIDADITLRTNSITDVIQDILPAEPFGFIGGLALTPEGSQNMWNYGPRLGLQRHLTEAIHKKIGRIAKTDVDKAQMLRQRFASLLSEWPDPLSQPVRKQVFWAIEQNLIIDSATFTGVGGFSQTLREHEIQVLAIKLHKKGLPRLFDPAVAVQHKNEQNVRDYDRLAAMAQAEREIMQIEGLASWIFPNGKFRSRAYNLDDLASLL